MTKKALYIIIPILQFGITALGQTNTPPPAMPKDSSLILVNKIIEVTKHEIYFIDYCNKKVKSYAIENNWTSEKTDQVLESIKFKYYNSTIYNSYSFYSVDQLKTLLDAVTLINNRHQNSLTMILTNSMMQSNLDLFVDGVIKGKYITTQ